MRTLNQLFQTYKQAPWRTQLQWIGLIMIAIASIGIVAAFYVNVTSRKALAGREIAAAKEHFLAIQHNISELESKIAVSGSTQNMQARAAAMGFIPAEPQEFVYIVVPGYTPKPAFSLAPKAIPEPLPYILPEYKESLFDWFTSRGQP